MRKNLAAAMVAVVTIAGCTGSGPGATAGTTPTDPPSTPAPAATASLPAPSRTPTQAPLAGSIAFIRPATTSGEGRVDIYLVDPATGALSQLTNDSRIEVDLFWLRDGSRLVYAWSTFADPYHQTLTSIEPDGSDPIDLGPVQIPYYPPAVAPDGRFVVFSGDGTEEGSSGLVRLDLANGTRTQLTTDGASGAILSPDGSRVLAILPSRRVVVIDAASGAELARIADSDVQEAIGWTPDGWSIVYHSCGANIGKLDCMDAPHLIARADGTDVRPYEGPALAAPGSVVASPDGRWLLSENGEGGLIVTAASGGPSVGIGSGTAGTWSPDSNWLVFSAAATEPEAIAEGRSSGLAIAPRGGGQAVRLTDGPYDQEPAWQP